MLLKPALNASKESPSAGTQKARVNQLLRPKSHAKNSKRRHVLNEISTNRMTCASSKTSGLPLSVSRRRKDYTVPKKLVQKRYHLTGRNCVIAIRAVICLRKMTLRRSCRELVSKTFVGIKNSCRIARTERRSYPPNTEKIQKYKKYERKLGKIEKWTLLARS